MRSADQSVWAAQASLNQRSVIALDDASCRVQFTRAEEQKTKDGKDTTYGLGWQLSERNGLKEVTHGGNQARVTTYLYMLPERGFAVVMMMNLENVGSRTELARLIADIVLQ